MTLAESLEVSLNSEQIILLPYHTFQESSPLLAAKSLKLSKIGEIL